MDQPQFDVDREAVLRRAQAAGVGVIVNPAVDLPSCERVVQLAETAPGLYAAVGIHPNDCEGFDAAGLAALRERAEHPRVVAIGEIGLDYYWRQVPEAQQKWALRAQLELAASLELPVILHSRESNEDLLWELEQWVPGARKLRGSDAILGVWHAFSGNLDEARRAYDLGFVLGLGGPVTFKNAHKLRELVPQLRLDRILTETDAPYMAPHPFRGRRNEPAHITLVRDALASLLGVTGSALTAQVWETAQACFRRLQV